MRLGLSVLLAVVLSLWGMMHLGAARRASAPPPGPLEPWRTPVALVLSPDGRELYVANRDSGTISRISVAQNRVTGEITVGRCPIDLAFSPAGGELFVACHHEARVVVVDRARFAVIRRLPVDPFPRGVVVLPAPSPAGRAPSGSPGAGPRELLYTNHTYLDTLVKRDPATGAALAHLFVGRSAWAIVPSPDRSLLAVTALQSTRLDPRRAPEPEVDIVRTDTFAVEARVFLEGANLVRGGAWTADGSTLILPIQRPKNLLPDVKPSEGWLMTHGLAVISKGPRGFSSRQLLLQDAMEAHTEPYHVVVDDGAGRVWVAAHGAGRVVGLDLAKLRTLVSTWPEAGVEELAGRLDLLDRFETARVPTGPGPRALALSPGKGELFVAGSLDDRIAVVDTRTAAVARRVDLHRARSEDAARRGQRLFSDNRFWYHGVVSCNSCHPESHQDGLAWDLAVDGLGKNRVDVRTLYGAAGTEPFKWLGSNAGFHAECGPRAARLILRSRGFDNLELDDCVEYLRTLTMPPNPFAGREEDEEAIERGKRIFTRTVDAMGRPIKLRDRCDFCHPQPRFTNRRSFDVETRGDRDTFPEFDTPQLENLFMTAPYLHDGTAPTLEECFTVRDPHDKHGVVNDLGKDELNDLIIYMRSLGPTERSTGPVAPRRIRPPVQRGEY